MGKFYLILMAACVAASPIAKPQNAAVEPASSPPTTLDTTTATVNSITEVKPVNEPAQEEKIAPSEATPTVNIPKKEGNTVIDEAKAKSTVNAPAEGNSAKKGEADKEESMAEGPESAESGEADDDDDLNTDASRWYRKRHYGFGYYKAIPRFYGHKAYFLFG